MTEKVSRVDVDVSALVEAIKTGAYTPEQVEAISTSIRVGLASSLMESITGLNKKESDLKSASDQISEVLTNKIKVDMESELLKDMDYGDLLDIFKTLSKTQMDIAEVKRRVFNGKELFAVDPLSSQDRALMDLFRTVGSAEKKEKLRTFLIDLSNQDDMEEFSEQV